MCSCGNENISIRVAADTARIYETASADERRKLDALVSSRLREFIRHRQQGQSLEEIMSDISRKAQERGLTQEKLDEILNED